MKKTVTFYEPEQVDEGGGITWEAVRRVETETDKPRCEPVELRAFDANTGFKAPEFFAGWTVGILCGLLIALIVVN